MTRARVAVLGTGVMGSGMARSLLLAGKVNGALMEAVFGQLSAASSAGYGGHDMAAVLHAFR